MLVFFFILGTIAGSYANSLIYRLGTGKKVFGRSRSYCPHCKKTLAWFDLIPLVSFLLLSGTCRHCKKRISLQYPLVEFAMGAGFAWSAWLAGVRMMTVPLETAVWLMLFVNILAVFAFVFFFVIDFRYFVIPDSVSLPLVGVILALNIIRAPSSWQNLLIAGILGAGFFALQYVVSRGRWVGGGDIRLGALLGVLLGVKGLAVALALAYIFGMTVALVLLALKKATMKTAVPFGVFLMAGGFVSLFWGEEVVGWYFQEFPILIQRLLGG